MPAVTLDARPATGASADMTPRLIALVLATNPVVGLVMGAGPPVVGAAAPVLFGFAVVENFGSPAGRTCWKMIVTINRPRPWSCRRGNV